MFRFCLRLTIRLLPLFTLLMVTVSALGSTQPIHPALRGFVEGCEGIPQPCWYGIVPGVTTLDQAENIFTEQNFQLVSRSDIYGNASFFDWSSTDHYVCTANYRTNDGVLSYLSLDICGSITLGDIFTLSNHSPAAIVREVCAGTGGFYINYENVGLLTKQLKINAQVNRLDFPSLILPADEEVWLGFALAWRYPPVCAG